MFAFIKINDQQLSTLDRDPARAAIFLLRSMRSYGSKY